MAMERWGTTTRTIGAATLLGLLLLLMLLLLLLLLSMLHEGTYKAGKATTATAAAVDDDGSHSHSHFARNWIGPGPSKATPHQPNDLSTFSSFAVLLPAPFFESKTPALHR